MTGHFPGISQQAFGGRHRAVRQALLVAILCLVQIGASTVARAQVDVSKYVRTPVGYAWPSCVHEIPSGARVDKDLHVIDADGKLLKTLPRCTVEIIPTHNQPVRGAPGASQQPLPDPDLANWVDDSYFYDAGKPFNYIFGEWNVPDYPATRTGQTLFFFNDLWASSSSALQPALQWGTSGAGGGAILGHGRLDHRRRQRCRAHRTC